MNDANAWVIDADAATFEKEVIKRSLEIPVVVDFWATWCGPCKTLGPLLERRAREGAGRFLLARIDVDQNPELAQAFRVQAIPFCLALVGGRMVDGFQGTLGETELDAFLDKIAPAGEGGGADALLDRLRESAGEGRLDEAIDELRQHLRQTPDHEAARLLLADLLVDAGRLPEAKKVFDKLGEETRDGSAGRALRGRIEFSEGDSDTGELEAAARARPDDGAARLALGKAYVAAKRFEEGLEELLQAVRFDPQGSGKAAKQTMLEVFEVLGMEDAVANDYRFKLSLEILV